MLKTSFKIKHFQNFISYLTVINMINIFIWNFYCYRSVGLQFNLAKSSLDHCVRPVVKVLCSISREIIKWPSVTRMSTVTEKFKRIAGLEHVLGAIDGSHIEIPAPSVIFLALLF